MKKIFWFLIFLFSAVSFLTAQEIEKSTPSKVLSEEEKSVKFFEVYTNSSNPAVIIGKLTDGTTKEIISSLVLPKRKNFVGEEIPFGNFSKVLLSPNRKYLCFYVTPKGVLDPGYVGLFYFDTSKNVSINLRVNINRYEGVPMVWSPDSKYLAFLSTFENMGLHNTIFLYELTSKKIMGPIFTESFYNQWKDVDCIFDLRWKDGKEIFFKARKTEFDPATKEIQTISEGIWRVDLDTTSIQKSNLQRIE